MVRHKLQSFTDVMRLSECLIVIIILLLLLLLLLLLKLSRNACLNTYINFGEINFICLILV